jgi:hypothetical protein
MPQYALTLLLFLSHNNNKTVQRCEVNWLDGECGKRNMSTTECKCPNISFEVVHYCMFIVLGTFYCIVLFTFYCIEFAFYCIKYVLLYVCVLLYCCLRFIVLCAFYCIVVYVLLYCVILLYSVALPFFSVLR